MEIDLNGEWQFTFTLEPTREMLDATSVEQLTDAGLELLPCTVPGNFELDLLRHGLIEEPYFGLNILELRQYEHAHVWYTRRFEMEVTDGPFAEFLFEGLDWCADLWLNGEWLGFVLFSAMIPRRLRLNLADLKPENDLLVRLLPGPLHSPSLEFFDYPDYLHAMPQCYEGLHVRKPPHAFGWDIMPRAPTAGIWRPVTLRIPPRERITSLFLDTLSITEDGASARLRLSFRLATEPGATDAYRLQIEGRCGGSVFTRDATVHFAAGHALLKVDKPKLWWPRNRGKPNLYEVTVRLLKNGEPIDEQSFTHGIRTVELERTDTTDDAGSGEFCFRINGEKVFMMGTNWVPADAFHSRDAARIPRMIELADEIGCNMIRCWGGNVYEDHAFFDECDRRGILVWQDFAMACAIYPQEEAFRRDVESEAREIVRRLRRHPSLVLWCGDNECDCAYAHAWTGRRLDPNENALTREVLPRVVREYDAGRPYLPSSPYISPAAYAAGAGNDVLPEAHLWGPRGWYKSDFYALANCHFVSEIGYFGCPSPASMAKFLSPEKLWPPQDNDEWILHSTEPVAEWLAMPRGFRVQWTIDQVAALFGGVPETLDEFAFASQVTQAEALKFFIEHFRGGKWRRTGILWWNLIDGWPKISDAVVDYYFQKKLAFDWIRRSQRPVLLMLAEPADGRQTLLACNDTRDDGRIEYTVRDVDTGEILAKGRGLAKADAVTALARLPYDGAAQRFYRIDWRDAAGDGRSHYLAGEPPFDLQRYRGWLGEAGLLTGSVWDA